MQQAEDFLAESETLFELIRPLPDTAFEQPTGFKNWTINNVIRHLHMWNYAADLTLRDGEAFEDFYRELGTRLEGGLRDFEADWLDNLAGQSLVEVWLDFYREMAVRFGAADPSMRVKWAGPGMSVRSSITARLMETWAHGQEIYDLLGVVRTNTDRIRNIVVLGVKTYGWTFNVRGEDVLQPQPHLRLTAPSGEIWTYNEVSDVETITGLAEEFCQVVTQVRNVADTSLEIAGVNAANWMAKAQCFAGPPQPPPVAGTRHTQVST